MMMEMTGGTPLEQLLTRLWAEVLEIPNLDRHTDFFAAGARAPHVSRLLERIEHTLHVAMPAAALEAAPSPAAFADALKHQVDHPGGLERLAERLLPASAGPPSTGGESAGTSW